MPSAQFFLEPRARDVARRVPVRLPRSVLERNQLREHIYNPIQQRLATETRRDDSSRSHLPSRATRARDVLPVSFSLPHSNLSSRSSESRVSRDERLVSLDWDRNEVEVQVRNDASSSTSQMRLSNPLSVRRGPQTLWQNPFELVTVSFVKFPALVSISRYILTS
jgi:hypothetical protein